MSFETAPSDAVLERLLSLHPKRIDLVLDRVERLLAALGHPETKMPPIIHVAGTNGKGSVCAYLRAMLEGSGYRVHVYTSPHLVHFHERIRIAGRLISEEELAATLEECEAANAGLPITFFEITTAAAFLAFSRHKADALVLEVWLDGGHNPHAGAAVAQSMADLEERSSKPLYLICGMLRTKDAVGYFFPFRGLAKHVTTIAIPGEAASLGAGALYDAVRAAGLEATPADDLNDAMMQVSAWSRAREGEGAPRILISGSLYLAGKVLRENG